MSSPALDQVTYHACCHCGLVRFSFASAPIKTGARCNCSLCVRRGAVLSSRYVPAHDFVPHANSSDLAIYVWNEHVLNNYFCRVCGIFVYIGDGANNRDGYRVNLGCVEGIDTLSLEISVIDGRSLPIVPGLAGQIFNADK